MTRLKRNLLKAGLSLLVKLVAIEYPRGIGGFVALYFRCFLFSAGSELSGCLILDPSDYDGS